MSAQREGDGGRLHDRVLSFLEAGSSVWPQYSLQRRRLYAVLLSGWTLLLFEAIAAVDAGGRHAFFRDLPGQLTFAGPVAAAWLLLASSRIKTVRQFQALMGTITFVALIAAGIVGTA